MKVTEIVALDLAQEGLIEATNSLLRSLGVGVPTSESADYAYERYRIARRRFDDLARSVLDRKAGAG